MNSILNRVFIGVRQVRTYPATSRSVVQILRVNCINTCPTLINNEYIPRLNEELDVEELFHNEKGQVKSVLEETEQLPDLSHVTPETKPSFNFAYFANKSEVIQQFINLGVNFHEIEQKKRLPDYLLTLDFEKDVKPYIVFLHKQGVPAEELGRFFTKNPFLFLEHLDDLQVRINYLQSKKFTSEMISRIISANPRWLSVKTKVVDEILGNFQKEIFLTADQIRYVVCKRPQIIALRGMELKDKIFLFQDVIGFDKQQTKSLFLKAPYAWQLNRDSIHERLDVMLVDMEIPLTMIEAQPSGLTCRAQKLKERHLFLKELGKAQYDPTKPNYVSIDDISKGNDATFCQKVAKTSVQTYNLFLKSL